MSDQSSRRVAGRSPRPGRRALSALVAPIAPVALAVLAALPASLAAPALRAQETAAVDEAVASGPSFTRKPRWEFGVGGGYFAGQDYPASDDPNRRALALPFFIYRSPVFRVGDGGLRAVAIERPRVRLDLSIGGSLNASSEDNGSRRGMPDLDFLFELGPQLEVSLLDRPVGDGAGERLQASFSTELRAVVATDLAGLAAQGFVAEAGLQLARRGALGARVDLIAGAKASVADERLQDYFYEVAPRFEIPGRAAHDARGGYLGSELSLGLVLRPSAALRVFVGLSHGLYAGAANADSPLFETDASTRFALGFAWTLARSARLIDVIESD